MGGIWLRMQHNLGAAMTNFRYPSFEEIRALELEARRSRSRELARLFGLAAVAVKSRLSSLFTINPVRVETTH